MAESLKVRRRKYQRRVNRSRVRQLLLMTDYIMHKYFDIYSEAAEYYNELNQKYPDKYDLRKTTEFKAFKTGQAMKCTRKLPKPLHSNIQTPIQINPEARITVIYEDQAQSPETPCEDHPQSPETPCEDHPQSPETPCEDHPQSPETPCEDHPQSPETPCEDHPQNPETPHEDQAQRPVELQIGKTIYTDNMKLEIPLLKPRTVTTETLQVVTQEILQEDTSFESSYEELAPEVVEKIISELRGDPDLKDIFTSVEEQLEFEQLGMDIDIDIEGNELDIELDQWF